MPASLSYDLSQRGELPLYEYLYRCIRDDIVAGAIAAEDRLPSKRKLAERLGVSLITIESAYAQLVAEGYVLARPRRGYYVAELPQVPMTMTMAPSDPHEAERPAAPAAGAPVIADFSRPSTSERSPAAALWSRALRSALAHEPESELFGPQPPQGSTRLREALADYLRRTLGARVGPERIVIGAGSQLLYVLVAQLLGNAAREGTPHGNASRPDDTSAHAPVFAIEDPGYPKLASIYRACGAQVRFLPLDTEGIGMRHLRESDASVVHVMPSHQFPTGRVTTIARRYELLSWASSRSDRYIIEDDYDREFRLAGKPIPPLASIDAQGRVIYMSTFSKSLSTALRMAYMVLPAELAERFDRDLGFYANTVSLIDQVTLARLLESGEYERHVSRYRKRQRDLRDALVRTIRESPLGPISRIEEADSGLHFVLALQTACSEEEIARRALDRGIVLAPLSGYLQDAANANKGDGLKRFVMQYGGIDASVLPQVADALRQIAASM